MTRFINRFLHSTWLEVSSGTSIFRKQPSCYTKFAVAIQNDDKAVSNENEEKPREKPI